MICVEGYKAFCGPMVITPKNKDIEPVILLCDWLYKPDTDCWYSGNGRSFPASICQPIEELDKNQPRMPFRRKE